MDLPAGVTQEEGPSAVLALIFLARRIQSFLSIVDREVESCVLKELLDQKDFGFGVPAWRLM